MDSSFMDALAKALAETGVAVARFEFPYMAARRTGGKKAPPPKAELLVDVFAAVLETVLAETEGPLLIGGKSMGGRVAAMVAGNSSLPDRVKGVVCVGYPFHPTGKPDVWRLEPLVQCQRPVLITQGERDPFGSLIELEKVALPEAVTMVYLEDGNHDLAPRKQSSATSEGNLGKAVQAIAAFAARVG